MSRRVGTACTRKAQLPIALALYEGAFQVANVDNTFGGTDLRANWSKLSEQKQLVEITACA
jgi:hypothetical protein